MSMLAYRMIAIDIDGTLLDPSGHIRPAVREAVRTAVERGVLVTLATGRRFSEAAAVAAELGLELPLVLHHGTVIQDSLTGEVLYEAALPYPIIRELVEEIVADGQQPVLNCSPAAVYDVLSGPVDHDNEATASYLSRQHKLLRLPYDQLALTEHVLSMSIFAYSDILRPLHQRLSTRLSCSATFWAPGPIWKDYLVEVIHADCSKATALAQLAARYGITMNEIMAIGDERNDIEMIESVGLGVAMGNAIPAVRSRARAVVSSNAADGVAEAIRRFVLQDD